MSVRVEVKGLAELQKTLTKFPAEVQRHIGVHAASDAAVVIQNEVTARAPIRQVLPGHKAGHLITNRKAGIRFPGTLKHHIVRRRRVSGVAGNKITYEVGPSKLAWYGRLLETGSRHAAARPFMRPAIDAKGQAAVDAFARTLKEGIDEAVRNSK
jgi:HK97 gp10 family phage protein